MEYTAKGLHHTVLPSEEGEVHYHYLFRVTPVSRPSWMPEDEKEMFVLVVRETMEEGKRVFHGVLPYRCEKCQVGLAVDFETAVHLPPYCPHCGKEYESVTVQSATLYLFTSWSPSTVVQNG